MLSLEQAQEASGQCLWSSEQQMQAQLQDKDSQLLSAQVCLQHLGIGVEVGAG